MNCWSWLALSLAQLAKTQAKRTCGIDASTNSVAFAVFDNKQLVMHGEFDLHGSNVFERVVDANRKMAALFDKINPDYVAVEAAIMVKSVQTGIKLAYVFGGVMAALLAGGAKVVEVAPISWQSYIGNKLLTKAEKEAIKTQFPGKSANWYSNKGREIRKQRTMDFAKRQFGVTVKTDNESDAIGVAWYAANNLTR